MTRYLKLIISVTLALSACYAQDAEREYPDILAAKDGNGEYAPMFPFKVTHGVPDNITNVQTWAGPWQPAGQGGFVTAKDSLFVDNTGPRYFTGTNICFGGGFPSHEKAEAVAADIARFGINLVRLHYVHHRFPPGKKYASPDSFIEPVQLEQFDYLFYQLKQRGIYTYMQLNIARKFGKESGFENADKLPWYNNGIDNIEPRMIALQKKYVTDLLTHVNPYTGLAYKDDPAIAMLELANENSIVRNWYSRKLDTLPEPYEGLFKGMWNEWLRKKYGNTAELRGVWGCRNEPLGEEMIPDGTFPLAEANETNYPQWGLQRDDLSEGSWEIVPVSTESQAPGNMTRLTIRKVGKTPNMPQFFRRFGIVEGTQYNLSFRLRVSPASPVSVRVSQDHDPWHRCGFYTTFDATGNWQDHSYQFLANMTDPEVRLVFANFAEGATVEIANVSFRPGGTVGLADGETLEDGTVPLPKLSGSSQYHLPPILGDMTCFLFDCEENYFRQMRDTVKNEVRACQPVTGTQLGYGFWYPQGRMDYCDIHSYWCHPAAPGGGSWTNPKMKRFWFVRNLAMVNLDRPEKSTIAQLAIKRIVNRPYTVSEYDHPYPNLYAAEGNPMLFALGAFQNWGGIVQFAWTHNDDYDPEVMTGYFDMKTNSVKQVHFPACYAMFTRGDVRRGPGAFHYTPELSDRQERELSALAAKSGRLDPLTSLLGVDGALSLVVFSGLNLGDLNSPVPLALGQGKNISSWADLPESMGSPERKWIRNEFGELLWNFEQDNAGYFSVDTPGTKIFTGFGRGRSFTYRSMAFRPGRTRLDWTTFSLVKAKGPLPAAGEENLPPGSYLLAATGLMHNTGTVLKEARPDYVSTAQGYGGAEGTAPILCEGIPAVITLQVVPEKVTVFALDQAGSRSRQLPVSGVADGTQFEIGPQYRTLWYEVIIE